MRSFFFFFFPFRIAVYPAQLLLEGIDINSTIPPSEFRMLKLVTNLKLMRVVKRVIDELKAAGFKTNSDVRSLRLVGGYGDILM